MKHPIGVEPINSCFEGKRCTNSAKDVKKYLSPLKGHSSIGRTNPATITCMLRNATKDFSAAQSALPLI